MSRVFQALEQTEGLRGRKTSAIAGAFYITAGCVNMGEPLWTSRLRYYFTATRQPSLVLSQPEPKQLDLQFLGTLAAAHQLDQPVAELRRIRSTCFGRGDLLPLLRG